jgi:hypothetical protein
MRQVASAKEAVKACWAPMRRELGTLGGRGCCGGPALRLIAALEMYRMTIRLRLSEPGLADALALFLSRRECPAEVAEDGTVMVELAHALHQEQARMELELYVRVWQALHDIGVNFLDEST